MHVKEKERKKEDSVAVDTDERIKKWRWVEESLSLGWTL
jgi:hypothetical protein